jgi:hypothetical protein
VHEKDPVQETVSALKSDKSIKTTIGEDAELRIPIWHNRTCEAFFMHVSTALNAIEKRGTFKAYKEAIEAYLEQREVMKQAKAVLAILTAPASKGKKSSKKASKKLSKKASEKALQKTNEGVALANAYAPELCVEYQADYLKAKFALEIIKNKRKAATTKIFQFYPNLLSSDAKYLWNKTVKGQTEADPFRDHQGVSRKGPRGLLQESFKNYVMFHLLTVFPNNATEQTKVLPFQSAQEALEGWCTSVCTVRRATQRLHQAASYNAGMTLVNVLFT